MQKINFNKVTYGLITAFLLVTIVSFTGQVNAQAPPNMPAMVTGKYSNSDYGVQVTFPDGWQAMEIKTSSGTSVIASKMSDSSTAGSPTSTIALNMMPMTTSTIETNPNIPTDPKFKCDTLSSDNTNVNGMSAIVVVVQCTSPDGDMKMKSYSFKTDKNLISVSYIAMPSTLYDDNAPAFDSAVNTLQIANTVSAPSVPQSTPSANPTTNSAVPEFPTIASLILVMSVFAVIGFATISRKSGLSFRN